MQIIFYIFRNKKLFSMFLLWFFDFLLWKKENYFWKPEANSPQSSNWWKSDPTFIVIQMEDPDHPNEKSLRQREPHTIKPPLNIFEVNEVETWEREKYLI